MDTEGDILYQLMKVIEDRKCDLPPSSYTTRLFEGGGGLSKQERIQIVDDFWT